MMIVLCSNQHQHQHQHRTVRVCVVAMFVMMTATIGHAQRSGAVNERLAPSVAAATVSGGIRGTVTTATTHRPLAGARIQLDGVNSGVMTDAEGLFQLTGVPAGHHTVLVKQLGYARVPYVVTVTDDAIATLNIVLEPSTNQMNQVVVTGTVIPTELRAVPNAMTIITAEDIEQRGITRIDQLFRGEVPGVFAQNLGSMNPLDSVVTFSRGASSLSQNVNTPSTNTIKTYVDGVELANPTYLNQIDPRSIERIEILTGPQASTIYGSNALNGVMQIFTKRGTSVRPQLTASLMSGAIQNNFSGALTPLHDYTAQVNGIESHISYNAGGSWNSMGAWTPAKRTSTFGGFGGVRMQFAALTTDVSFRRSMTHSLARGDPQQERTRQWSVGIYSDPFATTPPNGHLAPRVTNLDNQTIGLTVNYAPTTWWSHELDVGNDASAVDARTLDPGYNFILPFFADTFRTVSERQQSKTSLRYATTMRLSLADQTQAILTVGADEWHARDNGVSVITTSTSGTLTGPFPANVSRDGGHNAGAFLQGRVGVWDALFLTYGLRAEWNPNFGAEATPNFAPRYGIAYTHDVGPVTAKLRASYGGSTRPPLKDQKAALPSLDPFSLSIFGPFDNQLANPGLAPERQHGSEGGLELYMGHRLSFVVTRYNQIVDGLIVNAPVDSVRSLVVDPYYPGCCQGQYVYQNILKNLNIGSLRNQGWEVQGSATTGPVTTQGTYSWTKSRILNLTPQYAAVLNNRFGTSYYSGSAFTYLPEHTWAVNVTYARAATSVSLNVTGVGAIPLLWDPVKNAVFNARLNSDRPRMSLSGNSSTPNIGGYGLGDVIATHRFSTMIEGVLQIQNIANYYRNDSDPYSAAIGRQTKAGVRVRL